MPLRRPVPALIALLALLLLTALVWWRVLNRNSGTEASGNCTSTQPTPSATLPGPNLITVTVLNATDRTGIAADARTTLVADGFKSPTEAANDKPKVKIRGVAEIRYGESGHDGAKVLHYYFPNARMVSTKSKSATVVVSLGEKYRGVASPSSVAAELRRQNIALKTSAPGEPTPTPSC
ncbi:MAG TPA: LytR C-terminal domain-containing protein [Jatrophihabitans sp.]|jgi:hypothetical protein|nr:LytR C-terminal domain-containing protein [Jatrophihabitans sp.]